MEKYYILVERYRNCGNINGAWSWLTQAEKNEVLRYTGEKTKKDLLKKIESSISLLYR